MKLSPEDRAWIDLALQAIAAVEAGPVVVHDLDLVRAHFPQALLIARRAIAWGPSAEVVTPETMQRARQFQEAWDDDAPWCEPSPAPARGAA